MTIPSDDDLRSTFLEHIARESGKTWHACQELLTFIGAPPPLLGIIVVVARLVEILPKVRAIVQKSDGIDLDQGLIDDWLDLCHWMVEQEPYLNETFPEIVLKKTDRQNPFYGHTADWLLYLALYYRHHDPDLRPIHQHLQAHLLLTQLQFRQIMETEERNYSTTTIESTRMVRLSADLTQPKCFKERQPFLKLLSEQVFGQEDFLATIESLSQDSAYYPKPYGTYLDIVRRMLAFAIEHRGGHTRQSGQSWRAALEREALVTTIAAYNPEDSDTDYNIQRIQMPSQTKEEMKLSRQTGCSPIEVVSGVEHYILEEPQEPEDSKTSKHKTPQRDRSPYSRVVRSREMYRGIAMANQLLPNQWDQLSLAEVARFQEAVSDLVRDKNQRIKCEHHCLVSNTELAALLTAIYWTGNPLESVLTFRFSRTDTDLPKTLKGGEHRYLLESDEWVVGAIRPEYKTTLREATKPFLIQTAPYIRLHNQSQTGRLVKIWWQVKGEVAGRRVKANERIFSADQEAYIEAARAFLKELNQTYKLRLTLQRLANDLAYRLYHEGDDWAVVALITGRHHYLANVPLHYSAPILADLQQLYEQACADVTDEIYQELGKKQVRKMNKNPRRSDRDMLARQRTGCRYMLKPGRVKKLVSGLWKQFRESAGVAGLPDYLVELHNDYTLYVAELIGFSTGYRAVRDPLSSLAQVDQQSGFAIISDKDDDDFYNSRLVWLPSFVLEQLRLYQEHSRVLAQRLTLANPILAERIKTGDPLAPPFLFLLTDKYKWCHLRPGEIQDRLKKLFPVPVNVNRTYLRNRLLELGLGGEMVHYFLGHWENGQEPFGPDSTLSPQEYRLALEEPLTNLLDEDGWAAIPGLVENV
jgi:hypothetical protein